MAPDPSPAYSANPHDPRTERLKLLTAARQLHHRAGAGSISIDAVAKEAGSTPEIVSSYFQDGQEILLSLTAEDLNALARTIQPAEKKDMPAKADSVTQAAEAALPKPPATQPSGNMRKKPVLPAPLEQVLKDVAPDSGKEVITGAVARLERRMQVLEKAFGDVIERHEKSVRDRGGAINAVEDSIGSMLSRMDAADRANSDRMGELWTAFSHVTTRLDALELSKPAPHADSTAAAPVAVAPVGAPEVVPQSASEVSQATEMTVLSAPEPSPAPVPVAPEAKPTRKDSYLSDARRAALAAAENESLRSTSAAKSARSGSRSRFLFFACLAPVVTIGSAVLVLNRHVVTAEPVQSAEVSLPIEAARADDGGEPPESVAITPAQGPVAAEENKSAPAPAIAAGAPDGPAPADFHSGQSLAALTRAAEGGDSGAMRDAGLKYLGGDGVESNPSEAARWLMRAAYKGEPVAEYWLATLYSRGQGVPADAFQALHWYEASAKQGNRRAMHGLAVANFQGAGIAKNPAEAARWFKQAAELGLGDAQFNLGLLYEEGTGVPRSFTDAYKWHAIAAAQGDKQAEERLMALAKRMKPDEIKEAQAAAASFKPLPMNETANLDAKPAQPGG